MTSKLSVLVIFRNMNTCALSVVIGIRLVAIMWVIMNQKILDMMCAYISHHSGHIEVGMQQQFGS